MILITLNYFRTLNDEVDEIKKLLLKYGLPSNLKDLKLTDDVTKC